MITYRIQDGEVMVPDLFGPRRPEPHEVARIVLQLEAGIPARVGPITYTWRYRFWQAVQRAFIDGYRRGR